MSGDLRAEGLRVVDQIRKRVEDTVKVRIRELQLTVGASLNWFQPAAIQKMLDRAELQRSIE